MNDKSYQLNDSTPPRDAQRVFTYRVVFTKPSGLMSTGYVKQPSYRDAVNVIFKKYHGARVVFVGME